MTTKDYLMQIRIAKGKIKRLQLKRDEIREQMYSVSSPRLDGDTVKTSASGDGMLRLVSKVDALERDIVEQIETLTDIINRVSSQIERIPNERQRMVMFEYYVMAKTWEDIAEEWGSSVRYVYKVRKRAIINFEKLYRGSL